MYFGSVRFFKHLILTVTALLIIVPTVMCIILAVDNAKKSAEIDRLSSYIDELTQSSVSSEESSTENSMAEPSSSESVSKEEPTETDSPISSLAETKEPQVSVPEQTTAADTAFSRKSSFTISAKAAAHRFRNLSCFSPAGNGSVPLLSIHL